MQELQQQASLSGLADSYNSLVSGTANLFLYYFGCFHISFVNYCNASAKCVVFSFKILGQAYDVRLMLVLANNSYPVIDSDIYFVNEHSSGVAWIDPS